MQLNIIRVMKKHFLFIFTAMFVVFSAFAGKKNSADYEKLAQDGTEEEIQQAFKSNRSLPTQVFGTNRETFLIMALSSDRSYEIVKICLDNETDATAAAKDGKTPLMYAAQFSSDEKIIDLLLKSVSISKKKRKSAVLQKDRQKLCSFDYARQNPVYEIYLKLCEYAEDPSGFYLPESEMQEISDEQVNAEKSAGAAEEKSAEETENSAENENPLDRLETAKRDEIKQYTKVFLLDYEENGEEEHSAEEKKEFLVENPNRQDKNGVSLLMKAAKNGNDWDVNMLIKSGADLNLRDKDGWTALMYACRYQNSLSIVKTLVEKGAFVRVRNRYNATPLLMASDYSENPEIIQLLLKDRSVSEDEVFRAFIFAITGNSSSDHVRSAKVKLFLDMEIPLNRLWKGQTPLMYACQYGSSTEVIKQLLDAGANPEYQDEEGKTAFDYAGENKKLPRDEIFWSLNGAN